VAVQVEKSPEALFLYLATLKAGLVYLPLNTAYQAAEMEYFVGNAEPAVVVCSPKNYYWVSQVAKKSGTKHVFTLGDDRSGTLLEKSAPHPSKGKTVKRSDDDLAAILYTSGTTGRSKGAMLSHANLGSNAKVLKKFWAWKKGDVLLHALPIFHVHGLFVASHGALLNGSKMIWLPRLDTKELIKHMPRSTIMMGVPTFYVRLMRVAVLEDQSVCHYLKQKYVSLKKMENFVALMKLVMLKLKDLIFFKVTGACQRRPKKSSPRMVGLKRVM
jgi:malonyl-CoA/methylmalonyl-CoA synthetase